VSGPGGGPRATRGREIDLRDGAAVPPSQRLSVEWFEGPAAPADPSVPRSLLPAAPPVPELEPWTEGLDTIIGGGGGGVLRRSGSIAWRVAAGAGFAILMVCVWLAATAWQARHALQHARSQMPAVLAAVRDGDPAAASAVGSVADEAQTAYDVTHDPVWSVASRIPVLGRPLRTVQGLTEVTQAVSVGALEPIVGAVQSLRPKSLLRDGVLDVATLRHQAVPLTAAAVVLDQQRIALRGLDGSWVPQVAQARVDLLAQLDPLTDTAVAAASAAELAPPMLGADGPRRWFIGFQNPAEARGTGGLLGAWLVLVADGGRVRLESAGSDSGLPRFTGTPAGLSADFVARYAAVGGTTWANSNVSPDAPEVAKAWATMWQAGTGEAVDGVVMMDPTSLAAILKATGPVTVPGVGTVDAGNVEQLVLLRQYQLQPDPAKRKAIMVGVGTAAFAKLMTGGAQLPSAVTNLSAAAQAGHVRLFSTVTDEQSLLGEYRLDGAVSTASGPFAQAVVVDAGGDKLSAFLHQGLTYRVVSCTATGREVEVVVRLRNEAPQKGLPAYVTVRSDKPPYRTVLGQSRVELQVLTALNARLTSMSVDGMPVLTPSVDGSLPRTLPDIVPSASVGAGAPTALFGLGGTVAGRPAYGVTLELVPGVTRQVQLRISEPASAAAPMLPLQSMANPPSAMVVGPACRT
jgi:hypothetical protein